MEKEIYEATKLYTDLRLIEARLEKEAGDDWTKEAELHDIHNQAEQALIVLEALLGEQNAQVL